MTSIANWKWQKKRPVNFKKDQQKVSKSEAQRRLKDKNEQTLSDLWDNIKWFSYT